jgi:ferritin-like metal-binding protein YciE
LGDILYVERALADEALPKLIGEVQDEEFRTGHEKHLKQTQRHVANVESVFESLGAAYESLRRMAKGLGEDRAVELLDANLKDEKETLREVERIATRLSNEIAKQASAA